MSQYVSPYAYRLPPDTFLSRRDPNWYIGATGATGATALPDVAARELLGAQTNVALHEMAKKIDDVIKASFSSSRMVGGALSVMLPGVGPILLPAFANAVQAQKFLTDARDKMIKPGGAAGQRGSTAELVIAVIRDTSIPLDEVTRRTMEFLRETAKSVDDQIRLNQKSADIFGNTLSAFSDAAEEILKKAKEKILPKDEDIPLWVWAAGGIAAIIGIAYITGKVKS
jgi:hypothetical protein